MKRITSILLALILVLSTATLGFASSGNANSGQSNLQVSGIDSITWINVSAQDVEIYVTDGYYPIPGASVTFNGATLISDANGKALFENIAASNVPYAVTVSEPGFGYRETKVRVADKIIDGLDAKIRFAVSYWTPESITPEPLIGEASVVSQESLRNSAGSGDQRNSSGGSSPSSRSGPVLGTVGSWEFGAYNTTVPTINPTATEYNGKIYVMGGVYNGMTYPMMQIYDIRNNVWQYGAVLQDSDLLSITATCWHQSATLYEGKIYYIGNSYYNYVYDIFYDSWATLTSADRGFYKHTATEYNGIIYIAADDYNTYSGTTMVQYDIECGQWSEGSIAADFYTYYPAVAESNGKIFVMGGMDYSDPFCDDTAVRVYDISTNTWSAGANMPVKVFDSVVIEHGGCIYIIGGTDYNADMDVVQKYNISSDLWTTGANMPTARQRAVAELYDDEIYVMGGLDEYWGSGIDAFEVYKTSTNSWNIPGYYSWPLGIPVTASSMFMCAGELNGRIYVLGAGLDCYNGSIDTAPRPMWVYTIDDLPTLDVVSIADQFIDITVPRGTEKNAIGGLPATATVTLDDNSTTILPILWHNNRYDKNSDATYIFYGVLQLPPGIANPDELQLEAMVTVGFPPNLVKDKISSGNTHTVLLKDKVVSGYGDNTGGKIDVGPWNILPSGEYIIDILCTNTATVSLSNLGNVRITGNLGGTRYYSTNIQWTGVKDIVGNNAIVAAVRYNGSVACLSDSGGNTVSAVVNGWTTINVELLHVSTFSASAFWTRISDGVKFVRTYYTATGVTTDIPY